MTDSGASWDVSVDDRSSMCEMREWYGEQYPFCTVCKKWADEPHMISEKHKTEVGNAPRSSMQTPAKALSCSSRFDIGMLAPQMCLQLPNHTAAFPPVVGINCTSGRYLPGAIQQPFEVNHDMLSSVLARQIDEIVDEKLSQKMPATIQENEMLRRRVQHLEDRVQHLEEYLAWWGFRSDV